jgi:hypothetical protein
MIAAIRRQRRRRVLQLVVLANLLERAENFDKCYIRPAHLAMAANRFQRFHEYYNSADEDDMKKYVRLRREEFDAVHDIIAGDISHDPTKHRFPISSQERLAVFLRSEIRIAHSSMLVTYTSIFLTHLQIHWSPEHIHEPLARIRHWSIDHTHDRD